MQSEDCEPEWVAQLPEVLPDTIPESSLALDSWRFGVKGRLIKIGLAVPEGRCLMAKINLGSIEKAAPFMHPNTWFACNIPPHHWTSLPEPLSVLSTQHQATVLAWDKEVRDPDPARDG